MGILTQTHSENLNLEFEQQQHQPLLFLPGKFSGHADRWSIAEKEAFDIIESMPKADHITAVRPVHIFTDHSNLTYIFEPYGCNTSINKSVSHKFVRWALRLSAYRYVIEHIPGDYNVWADPLTRWAVCEKKNCSHHTLTLIYSPINQSSTNNKWHPKHSRRVSGLVQNSKGELFIPHNDEEIQFNYGS